MKIEGLYQRNGVYWFRKTTNGQRIAVSLQTKDFAEAVSKAVEMRDGIEKESNTTILSSAITQFIRVKSVRRAPTISSYRFALNKLTDGLGDRSVRSVSAQWLEERVRELELKGRSPVSINVWIGVWRVFFKWCESEKLIKTSPALSLEYQDTGSTIRDDKACSKEERDALIAGAVVSERSSWTNDDLKFVLLAGFHAGMRKLEIVEARRDWFDLDRKMIHIKRIEGKRLRAGEKAFRIKDGTERKIPLTNEFHSFLVDYLTGRGTLDFALRPQITHGSTYYRTDIAVPFEGYMKEVGMEWVTPHIMRHTFCTLLIQNGRPLDVVAFWMGDTPEVIRKHYAHLVNYDASINL